MGTASTILPIVGRVQNSNLLLIEDVPISTSIRSRLLQQGCSFVVLPKENDMFETFNFVKRLFSERQWFYEQSYALYNELLTGKDPSHSRMASEQVQLFSVFSKIMVHHLGRTKHENANQLINSEKLFTDLIENQIHSQPELSARLKLSGLSLTKPYYLVMLKDDKVEARRNKTESLHTQLSKLYPESQQIMYKNSLLLLVSKKEWDSNRNSKKQSLLEILKQKNLRAIYSDYITDLLDLSSHYHCLVKGFGLAARLDRQEVLLPYSELKFYQMLHDIVDKDKLLYYCHPEILKLLNYDIDNNTAYYETLQAFLLNRQNLNDTANQLFIHRNTIKYRLRKIKEIVEIDLTRGETVFQLAYSFKILNYLKKWDDSLWR